MVRLAYEIVLDNQFVALAQGILHVLNLTQREKCMDFIKDVFSFLPNNFQE